jgi:hypothetical protein
VLFSSDKFSAVAPEKGWLHPPASRCVSGPVRACVLSVVEIWGRFHSEVNQLWSNYSHDFQSVWKRGSVSGMPMRDWKQYNPSVACMVVSTARRRSGEMCNKTCGFKSNARSSHARCVNFGNVRMQRCSVFRSSTKKRFNRKSVGPPTAGQPCRGHPCSSRSCWVSSQAV